MADRYTPTYFVLEIKTLSHIKDPGYMLETWFGEESFQHKPEKPAIGVPSHFFNEAKCEFAFRPRGVISFILMKEQRRVPLAKAELDLSELAGPPKPVIVKEIPMEWLDNTNHHMRPRLSFRLKLIPEPPAGLQGSVWDPTPSTNVLINTSNPGRLIFNAPSVRPAGSHPPTDSLWIDLMKEPDQTTQAPPLTDNAPLGRAVTSPPNANGGNVRGSPPLQQQQSPYQENAVGRPTHPPHGSGMRAPPHSDPRYANQGYPGYPGNYQYPGGHPTGGYRHPAVQPSPYPYSPYPAQNYTSGPHPQQVVPAPTGTQNPYHNIYEEGRRSGKLQNLVRRFTQGLNASPRTSGPTQTNIMENNDPRLSQQAIQGMQPRR